MILADASAPSLDDGSVDVVLCRHVLWALPDPAEVVARWVRLLRPAGRLVLVEGFWHTGAGLRAEETRALVLGARSECDVYPLDNVLLWGGLVSDERYLVTSVS